VSVPGGLSVLCTHRTCNLPADEHASRRLRRDAVRVRRAVGGVQDPLPDDLPADLALVQASLSGNRASASEASTHIGAAVVGRTGAVASNPS